MTELKKLFLLLNVLLINYSFVAQKTIDVHVVKTPIISILKDLSTKYDLTFFYSNDLKDLNKKVTIDLNKVPLKTALLTILEGTNLVFKFINNQILIKKKSEVDLKDKEWIIPLKRDVPIKKDIQKNKETVRISGFIKDSITGEELIGAIVYSSKDNCKGISNNFGYYSILISKGIQTLRFSCNGYISDTLLFNSTQDSTFSISLKSSGTQLPQIIIIPSESLNLLNDLSSKRDLTFSKNLSKGSLSTDDIIENVKLQAGVLSKSEGSTGYSVRGGNHDQNLILIDGAPVYNESHFLGLLSVFNSNSIKKTTLYKSGIPAEFGSRLSSVLDIQTKDGNKEKFNYHGSISPFFIDYSVEGPIKKDTSSFFVSGRNSILGLLFKPLLANHLNVDNFKFYDLNTKLNFRINDKNKVFLSGYFGRDVFKTNSSDAELNESWGNLTSSFKWNHIYNPKLFSNTHLIYSNYQYNNFKKYDDVDYFMSSRINSFIFKHGISYYYSNSHKFSFGIQSQFQNYLPGNTEIYSDDSTPANSDTISLVNMKFNNTMESAVYGQDDIKISDKMYCSVGLRFSLFNNIGEGKNYIFSPNNTVDTIFKSGIYTIYSGLEPRLKLSYKIAPTGNITASYDRTYQYLTLASNSISRSPTDIWVPSTNNILPQNMNLFSLGFNYFFDSSKYILNSSIYYKEINNIVDFIDNAYLKLNQLIESQLKQGKGTSYGFELMVGKTKGDFTFTFNYHLGKAMYTISEINNGKPYFAPYHKLHSGNLSLNYKLNSQFDFQSNFILSSGTRSTFPIATYFIQGTQFTVYNERNANTLPVYFRVDFSITYHGKVKKWGNQDLIFSVYNALNRKNPYSITFEKNTTVAYYNYLLPIIPSLTYKIHLK